MQNQTATDRRNGSFTLEAMIGTTLLLMTFAGIVYVLGLIIAEIPA